MKKIHYLIVFLCCVSSCIGAEGAHSWTNVKIVTEDLAPLGYVDKKDNKLKGETAERVQSAIKRLGIKNTINVYPWARALEMAENEDDVFIFNLARTPNREKKFKWVCKTGMKKAGVFALRERHDIVVKDFEDLKKYKIVVLNQNIAHLALLKKGFDKVDDTYFHPLASENQIISFLYMGRSDVWIKTYLNEDEMDEKIRGAGKNPDELVKIFDMDEMKTDLYLAASLKTSDEKVAKFRGAMELAKHQ